MRQLIAVVIGFAAGATSGPAAHADLRRAAPVIEPVERMPPVDLSSSSRVLWLDRCASGCTVHVGPSDAANDTSSIPKQDPSTLAPFAFTDAEWTQVVTCVTQVYSPFDIEVTDRRPAAGVSFNKVYVAGLPQNVGLGNDVLGIAPLAGDCRALSNTPAFAFANQHPASDRVNNICWTVSQEAAHAYGLDHEFVFVDGGSTCIDPMTYRTDCGGEKFFRDRDAYCGESANRECTCPGTQNSHQNLLGKFGAGTVTSAAPTVSIVVPLDQTTFVQGQAVQARAKAQRGVTQLDLYLNGYRWMTVPGGGFGPDGQPESTYPFVPPSTVPDGVIDIVVRASDDLGIVTASSTVTVTKGLPCADASSCAVGQQCEAGRCFWDPPTGEIGDACEYKQSCVSDTCQDGTCEQPCDAAGRATCPDGFTCGEGICVTVGGGCCSVSGPGVGWVHGSIAAIILGVVLRRRPKQKQQKQKKERT